MTLKNFLCLLFLLSTYSNFVHTSRETTVIDDDGGDDDCDDDSGSGCEQTDTTALALINSSPTLSCSSDQFACLDGSKCIRRSWLCDGDDDCDDYGFCYIYGGISKNSNMVLAVEPFIFNIYSLRSG